MSDGLDPIVAALLGLLQGVTEFLPVSSSGHLAAAGLVFEIPEMSLALVVLLHLGTLLATVAVMHAELRQLAVASLRGLSAPRAFAATDDGRLLVNLVVASGVTVAVAFGLRDAVDAMSSSALVVGCGGLVTAGVLWSTRSSRGARDTLTPALAAWVGLAQGIAVVPGVSRSGMTIGCAMALGLSGPAAFRFSFLLSVPVIAGATWLEVGGAQADGGLSTAAWIGAGVATATGYVALRLLRDIVSRGRLWLFSAYMVPFGVGLILWSRLGG